MKPIKQKDPSTPKDASHSATIEVSYRSNQVFVGIWVMLLGIWAWVAFDIWRRGDDQALAIILPAFAALFIAMLLVLGRLVIELRGLVLHWRYGWLGWPRWRLPLDDIADMQTARVGALQGGIKFQKGQSLFSASLSGPALQFTRKGGHRIVLGSPEPERLAQFIRARLPTRR